MKPKLKQLLFLSLPFLISCGESEVEEHTSSNETIEITQESEMPNEDNKIENAFAFINAYVDNCNQMSEALDAVEWANASDLATSNFKSALQTIMDAAFAEDPEMGLGADPILDAQDYPENGFELESSDENSTYLTLKGIDWPEFKLTVKMSEENGKWLVDGCGMVNIPDEKRGNY